MESTFLLTLGSFLSIYLASGCEYNNQCAFGVRCCKQTEAGRVLEEGKCVFRVTCSSFCLKTDDCLPPERCDTSRFNCTTKCSNDTDCHLGYICENDHCVSNETKHNDISESVTSLDVLLLLPFVLIPGLCYSVCFLVLVYSRLQICVEKLQSLYLRHRGRNCTVGSLNGNPPTSTNAPQQNNVTPLELNFARIPVDDSVLHEYDRRSLAFDHLLQLSFDTLHSLYLNGQQNAETLETDSIRPPVHDSNGESFDTNPSSTPPSCIEVSDVSGVAPPPYESIHTSVVLPNELQNAETLETDSIRPPVYDSNSESFDTNLSSNRPACIEVSDVPEVPPPPYESIITLVVFPNELQNAETLETDSTRPPVLETNGESFDNIASRGPPSYSEIFDVPATSLPTYEETTGDSTESLNI